MCRLRGARADGHGVAGETDVFDDALFNVGCGKGGVIVCASKMQRAIAAFVGAERQNGSFLIECAEIYFPSIDVGDDGFDGT